MDEKKIKVVVVDDSALVRSLLCEIINRQTDMACIGMAPDPYAAREVIRTLNPDVITLDVEMPKMDGLDFLSRLMRLRPMPVIMVSTLTERGAEVTLRALELGAVDFVAKPKAGVADGLMRLSEDITEKIRIAARAKVFKPSTSMVPSTGHTGPTGATTPTPASALGGLPSAGSSSVRSPLGASAPPSVGTPASVRSAGNGDRILFIGASTGGTEATREVLVHLPADCPPVLITQHMPAGFTANYARRLNTLTRIQVKEAEDRELIKAGHAYIAPGGRHMRLTRGTMGLAIELLDTEPVNRHRPSVEVLFESAAQLVGSRAIGVMLTGMGADGAAAMRTMHDAGAYNIAQDEASCVVFGMPREAIRRGGVSQVLPLASIGPHLVEMLRTASPSVGQKQRLQV